VSTPGGHWKDPSKMVFAARPVLNGPTSRSSGSCQQGEPWAWVNQVWKVELSAVLTAVQVEAKTGPDGEEYLTAKMLWPMDCW